MNTVSLIGIDLGKHSFHLHAQDRDGRTLFRKKLSRKQLFTNLANIPACTIAMEACAGCHWIARRLSALGHEVRLISPKFVKPFVQSNKSDFIDAEAICEAARRPNMRFVTPRTQAQQVLSAMHRVRDALVRQRTVTLNQIHAFLLEFGLTMPKGRSMIGKLPATLAEHEAELPPLMTDLIERLRAIFKDLNERIGQIERLLLETLHEDRNSVRLLEIPGIGPITASVLAGKMADVHQYSDARQFAASIGLVPRQYSTGGKPTLLGISKRGDKNLRRLLVQGARAVMREAERRKDALGLWIRKMLTRRHSNVVACALANKLARIAWAILARGTHFRSGQLADAS